MRLDDTIFALATAPGRGGIAVVRVSGPRAGEAVAALGAAPDRPRVARRARFVDPRTGEIIDQGLLLWFPAPASYTGEDVGELHIHGGRAVATALLEALGSLPGLRLAEPGEFTRRGFEHGKLDLTEAEAVADLVAAETAAQRRQALAQLGGALGALYEGWREALLRALAHLEAAIDFPEEDLPTGLEEEVAGVAARLAREIGAHLADRRRGERLRDGVSIAILGPPNAGKSSLLNVLARRDAAITSAVAGTTRDVIEVHLDLGGYPVILADTAGLRETADPVEAEGVRRARARGEAADLKLLVFAADEPASAASLAAWQDADAILVATKVDLVPGEGRASLPAAALPVSAVTGEGLDALLARLEGEVADRLAGEGAALTRTRHRKALEEALAALELAGRASAAELLAEDLRLATRALGRITGRVDVEDVLDLIFREFCIGK
jgi:tRNA modification GTPase